MQIQIKVHVSDKLALRDPDSSELGKNIVRQGIILMHQLGFEQFTFRKLAQEINTTEASIYRYFENKHRLLLYILTWYWHYLQYVVVFSLQNMEDSALKIRKVVDILSSIPPEELDQSGIDKKAAYKIFIAESSKVYLTKEVGSINQEQLFKPYKDLCGLIAQLFLDYNPDYRYPRSLASTLIEMAHFQPYFKDNLPSLTDFGHEPDNTTVKAFLEQLVFSALK
jgi:AcrR family transcriptional regulator